MWSRARKRRPARRGDSKAMLRSIQPWLRSRRSRRAIAEGDRGTSPASDSAVRPSSRWTRLSKAASKRSITAQSCQNLAHGPAKKQKTGSRFALVYYITDTEERDMIGKTLLMASIASLATPLMAKAAPATPAASAAAAAFDKADAAKATADLATALAESYVFPDKGEAYAAMLRAKLAAGDYAAFADAESFATRVTADLQAVHKDKHVRLRPVSAEMRAR